MFFYLQLEAAKIVLPVNMYKQITASLEKWVENPVASIQPYAAMRRIYPTNHSESNDKEEVPSLNRCVNFNLYHVN